MVFTQNVLTLSSQVVDALSFLAHFYVKRAEAVDVDMVDDSDEHSKKRAHLITAQRFCERLLDCPIPEKEEAKALLMDIETKMLHVDGHKPMETE